MSQRSTNARRANTSEKENGEWRTAARSKTSNFLLIELKRGNKRNREIKERKGKYRIHPELMRNTNLTYTKCITYPQGKKNDIT